MNALVENVAREVEAKHGGSYHAAEQALGLPAGTLWRIGTGRAPSPRLPTLQAVAQALGLTVDELVSPRAEAAGRG